MYPNFCFERVTPTINDVFGIGTISTTEAPVNPFAVKEVIFNNPATIVYWEDGTKTVVKCGENDWYDEEKGLAMCFTKKALGNKGNYNDVLKKLLNPEPKKKTKKNDATVPMVEIPAPLFEALLCLIGEEE